jgi:hypothetical protein
MASARQRLLLQFPRRGRGVDPDGDVAEAVYSMLWSIEGLGVDGWSLFRITQESNESLEAIGLMTLLPHGSIPIAIVVKVDEHGLAWSAKVGQQDQHWLSLSDSKRWNSVYLYASGDQKEPQWAWGRQYSGRTCDTDD